MCRNNLRKVAFFFTMTGPALVAASAFTLRCSSSLLLFFTVRTHLLLGTILAYGILSLGGGGVFAAESPNQETNQIANQMTNQGRLDLARSFVARLKGKMAPSSHIATPATPEEDAAARAQAALSRIPVGEEMQFRPRAGRYLLDDNIYAIKGEDDFYLSLYDLVASLGFAIRVDDTGGTASGWFLREDWPFTLDLAAGTLQARGEQFTLMPERDYRVVDDEIFVAGRSAEEWLQMEFTFDPAQQYVEVKSDYPLPAIARLERLKRRGSGGIGDNIARNPRQDFDYDMLSLSAADIAVRSNYFRPGDGRRDPTLYNRTDIALAGQLLKHDAYSFFNIDDRDGLNAISLRLSRDSDEATLLGPLRARSYSIGDIGTVNTPLTGYASQELGFYVGNNPLGSLNFQNTRISGNGLPGWDVELYRGNTLMEIQTIDETGRYEFSEVQLYAGDNEFEVYFYGNQGEVRRERLNIPLNAATLAQAGNSYEASFSLTDRQTYRRLEPNDPDLGTAHVAGQYNFYVGDALAYVGMRARQEDDVQKFYTAAGLTTVAAGFVLDAGIAMDEQGSAIARAGARRNIGDWRVSLSGQVRDDDYSPSGSTGGTLDVTASVNRSFDPVIGQGGNFTAAAQYSEFGDALTRHAYSASIGQGIGPVSFSLSSQYDETQNHATNITDERLTTTLSARGRITPRLSVRGSATHRSKPDNRMERYVAEASYRHSNKTNMDLSFRYQPEQKRSETEFRLNHTHDKFRISPFLRLNSDNDFAAGINVTTTLVNLPEETLPRLTSQRVATQGMVSALVFLDKNGNRVFDDGDEVLPDVVVESLNSRRRTTTGDGGYALLDRLSTTIATDLRVDRSSLPDPFMIVVGRDVSVLPRMGKIYEMAFPVQFAGELDGTVYLLDANGTKTAAKFVEAILIPARPDDENKGATLRARAAQDGFFLFDSIPPGDYYLSASAVDAAALKSARGIPERIFIDHTGTVLYAHDLTLHKGLRDIGFDVIAAGDAKAIREQTGLSSPGEVFLIRGGDEKASDILQKLHALRGRGVVEGALAGLPAVEATLKDGTAMRWHRAAGLEDAWQRCDVIATRNLPCHIDVLPAPHPTEIAAAAGDFAD